MYVQQEPPVSEAAAIPEPEIVKEGPVEHDLLTSSTAEEAPAVSTSEPETSYAVEGTSAAMDHNLLTESGSPDEEKNAVSQSETIEPRATEVEHMFSTVDVADDKTSDSAPLLAATEQLPEVVSQEIIQPQSAEVLVTESVLDDKETITSSTKLEGDGTTEDIEAKEDFVVVKEVGFTCIS